MKSPKPSRFVRMFKPQFAELVRNGIKTQTIRPTPTRMPQPGDIIDCRMWSGRPYGSPQVKIKDFAISSVRPISIHRKGGFVTVGFDEIAFRRENFARADGFKDWVEMRDWFQSQHGLPFRGILIMWRWSNPARP